VERQVDTKSIAIDCYFLTGPAEHINEHLSEYSCLLRSDDMISEWFLASRVKQAKTDCLTLVCADITVF
jgi:hypothetical protein